MNAFAKLKLTGELNTLKADMAAMSAFQKLKATKRVGEIAVLLGGDLAAEKDAGIQQEFQSDMVRSAYKYIKENDVLFAQVQSQDLSPITYDDFIALINADEKSGFSIERAAGAIERAKAQIIDLESGKIKPAKILGTGATKKQALDYLSRRIVDDELAVETKGRVVQVNALNFNLYLKNLIKDGKPESYVPAETLPDEIANLTRLFPILTKFVDAAKARGFHAVIGWGGARASNKANGSAFPEISLLVDGEYKDKIVVRQWIDGKYHVFAIYAASEGNFNAAFDEAEKQAPVETSSEETLPTPTKYRTGKEGSNIQLETNQLHLLGEAEITSLGSENIYIRKDGLNYYCKVMTTERYAQGEWDFAAYPEGKDDTGQNDTVVEPTSNPLYQSVIDGDEVTTSLIEQVLEQAKTEADPASNAQLTQAVEIIRKKVIELAGA